MFSQVVRFINNLPEQILPQADMLPLDSEATNRLQHYTIFLLLGMPIMLIFSVFNLVTANYITATLVMFSCMGLFTGWRLIPRLKNGNPVYRINIILFGALVLYLLTAGGESGSKILWMYTFPLIAFFLFGKNEGFLWNGLALLLIAGLLWSTIPGINVYPYTSAFKIRFVITYLIVSTTTFWFEYLRDMYQAGMQTKQIELELESQRLRHYIEERERAEKEKERLIIKLQTALDEVKTLSGLIPICANCKRVRSDEGYWQQVEEYIVLHSEADFSHGICPDCMDTLYPEYRDEKR